jgi:magnesium-transporting ATPase (P-type)
MDIEKQKKNVRQAAIVFFIFLALSLFMYEEIWYSWAVATSWLNFDVIKFWAVLLFSIPITIFYGILWLIRFLELRKMRRFG